MTLYQDLAQDIENLIARGHYLPGQRIPSVRHLSQERAMSVATVLSAYELLEAKGLVSPRPQSGYFVSLRPHMTMAAPQSPALHLDCSESNISKTVQTVLRGSRDSSFTSFGCALPDPRLLPINRFKNLFMEALRQQPQLLASYDFPPGNLALRQLIAARSAHQGNADVQADDVVITPGCMEAITMALQMVTKPGDRIIIESPTFFGFLSAAENLGLKVIEAPTCSHTGIDLDFVRKALSKYRVKAVVVIPNFSNPTGALMPDAHKEQLVNLCLEKDVPIIEDNIYADLAYDGRRPKSLLAYDQGGQVISCSSFSKTLTAGLRVGWMITKKYAQSAALRKLSLNTGLSQIDQTVLTAYLGGGGFDRHLRRLQKEIAVSTARLIEAIGRHFPKGTSISQPRGGFVIWVKLPRGIDSVKLYHHALHSKINIAPGVVFSSNGAYKNYIRLNSGVIWSEKFEAAVRRIGELASLHCSS